jgi:hypothetical protein
MVAARGMLTVTIPGLAQTGELVARAVFAIQKGAVSLDTFIAELKAAKLIADTGLTPEELLLVKDAFTRAQTMAADEKWVAELEKAMCEGDWVRVKQLVDKEYVLKAEAKYLKGGKHGVKWTEGGALAKSTGTPQGQWGSIKDLEFAGKKAGALKAGEGAYFELPAGHTSIVHLPDGSIEKATHIWVRNNGSGTFHGYPLIK